MGKGAGEELAGVRAGGGAAPVIGEMDGWAGRLAQGIAWAVRRSLEGAGGAALSFSGGVDSALIAHLAARSDVPVRLYTVGLPGAPDLGASERSAAALGLAGRHSVIVLRAEEALEAAGRVRALLPGATLLEVSFLAPSFLVFERAGERRALTGDGADELFGGYHRYLSMAPAALATSLEKDARELLSGGFERNRRLAAAAGKEVSAPYLDPEVAALARAIPPHLKVAAGERKVVLRRAAALLGLPPELCALPKRAAQYGTGIHALLTKKKFKQAIKWT
jgi:asparagine synthase (glutamine-hydrolysing)